MDDIKHANSQSNDSDLHEMLDQQLKMEEEWLSKKKVTPIRFDPGVNQFVTPDNEMRKGRNIKLEKEAKARKKMIFSSIYTAHFLYFYTEEFPKNRPHSFNCDIPMFINYLNDYDINKKNQIDILKDYETYRVTVDKVKPKSTGLPFILVCIKDALDYKRFSNQLHDSDYSYLYTLTKTKVAPGTDTTQVTMTEWFGRHTWLRRDDCGIGHNLFTRLASPKIVVSSFISTSITTLLVIQSAKDELISLFRTAEWNLGDIPVLKEKDKFETYAKYVTHRHNCFSDVMNHLRISYHEYDGDKEKLLNALKIITCELTNNHRVDDVIWRFKNNREIITSLHNKNVPMASVGEFMFSYSFMRELINFATSENHKAVPVCKAEQILFAWIMAYKTVQPSDISKLSLSDFRFVRRRNGQITHIDLEYFKGRSGVFHTVKTLETRTDIGKAVLRFLNDKGCIDENTNLIKKVPSSLAIGRNSELSRLLRFCYMGIRNEIEIKLEKEKISPVFLEAISVLIEKGTRYDSKTHKMKDFHATVDYPLEKNIFGLSMIKNSAIHARSDTFNPTQLMNYHSHTNETERKSYLSPQNEEWLNNCGRITRSVMQDLTVNLFRASQKGQKLFNSEFVKASTIIDNKRDEVLAKMKLVTGTDDGNIDEFGFVQLKEKNDVTDHIDTVYMYDSSHTVMKLKHYIEEVRKKYKLLMDNAPEYLLFTVLPTVEWIEVLFEQKKFQKRSVKRGNEIFNEYKDILPPLFTAQIGGKCANT